MITLAEKKVKRDAFTLAYSNYYSYIYGIVNTKVGNEDDVNDICQEIFLLFFKKFEEVENHRKWLLGTMRNVIYRYYEKKSNTPVDIDSVTDDVSLTYVNGFRDIRIIVDEAMENVELSEEEMLLLEYIAYNRFSYNNVCNIMGLTKMQLRYRYSQAVKKILAYLKEKGIHNIEDLL